MPAVGFAAPPVPQYAGGCSTEPALFALHHLATWRTDVTVHGELYRAVELLAFLKALHADPARYGVTEAEAQAATQRFLAASAPLLEREGGERAWLEREFAPGR